MKQSGTYILVFWAPVSRVSEPLYEVFSARKRVFIFSGRDFKKLFQTIVRLNKNLQLEQYKSQLKKKNIY